MKRAVSEGVDKRFVALFGQVKRATGLESRGVAIEQYLGYAESLLIEDSLELGIFAFLNVNFLLTELVQRNFSISRIWSWLEQYAKARRPMLRRAFQIGFLEDIVDPPVVQEHVLWLWGHWHDPKTRWMVRAAYSRCPQRLVKGRKLWLAGLAQSRPPRDRSPRIPFGGTSPTLRS